MIDEIELKERYLRDPIPIRLGNLASSVKRVGFLILTKKLEGAAYQLFHECQLFSSWTFSEANFETKTVLDACSAIFKSGKTIFKPQPMMSTGARKFPPPVSGGRIASSISPDY